MGDRRNIKKKTPKTTAYNGNLEIAREEMELLNLEEKERESIKAKVEAQPEDPEVKILEYFKNNKGNVHKKICKNKERFRSYPKDYKEPCSGELYDRVKKEFEKLTEDFFEVIEIKSIINPYVYAAFILRRKEYDIIFGKDAVRMYVFHGSTLENIKQIIKTNFDWRLRGTSKGNIFGQGVSFSPKSTYARHYGDKTETRFMIMARMLKCNECDGDGEMIVPPELPLNERRIHYDTSKKPNGDVLVKYRDDEFYPLFLIKYKIKPKKKTQKTKDGAQNQKNVPSSGPSMPKANKDAGRQRRPVASK